MVSFYLNNFLIIVLCYIYCIFAFKTCYNNTICSEGRPLPHNHRQKAFPNGTLIIEDLQKARDDGLYNCVAENNRSRTARRDVSLNIMGMPKLVILLHKYKMFVSACIESTHKFMRAYNWLQQEKIVRVNGKPKRHALKFGICRKHSINLLLILSCHLFLFV